MKNPCLQTCRVSALQQHLRLSEDVWAQLVTLLQDALGLIRRNVDLQRRRHGGVDEAADDDGDLLLDGGLVAVGVTEVLWDIRNEENTLWYSQ